MRRNLWKKVTSATLCAAMVGGIMVSNGALAVQAEEGEEKNGAKRKKSPFCFCFWCCLHCLQAFAGKSGGEFIILT